MCKSKNQEVSIIFRALLILMVIGICTSTFFVRSARASTFTVTNTNDIGPGSLRQAIVSANANPGFDVIEFSIPRRGVQTILPSFPLPVITDSVMIDGWTQGPSGYEGPPLIQISGTNSLQLNVPGLRIGCFSGADCPEGAHTIEVNDSTVRGLIINGFQAVGTSITRVGLRITGQNNTVMGCYIGTTANGEAEFRNGVGIAVRGSDNLIGGTTVSARNVISGNLSIGVSIQEASENNRIQGNYIGLSASGLHTLTNFVGVKIEGSNNLVGGSTDGARNVISGNEGAGVSVSNDHLEPILSNRIQGNYIGTGPDGIAGGFGNHWGVRIHGACEETLIGGPTARYGNVISGNGGTFAGGVAAGGIMIGAERTRLQNNLIGVGADRTTEIGNHGDGILVASANNQIGGFFTFMGVPFTTGNIIAFNQGRGISLFDALFSNWISHNKVYANDGLGIDLNQDGVSFNDICDFDSGSNFLQNFPVLTSIVPAQGGGIKITGYVPGNIVGYRVEFFNSATCDPSAHGEGERFIGSVNTGPVLFFCEARFVATLSNVTPGELDFITATATDPDNNTSEFSTCLSVR